MTKATVNKLLELLRRSGLVEEPRLASFLEKTAAAHGEQALEDQDRLVALLIEGGLVTQWQADKLLAGKHKGFRLGKYKLLGQIGKGGMSSVYLAEHEGLRRRVAIKVLPQNRVNDASYLDRFRLEAVSLAKLDDPNIVRVYDIENEKDIHYIVMEYVAGQDLHQVVSTGGPMDFDAAADYIAQVANGLQHAHEMGLVHRDIKPANCLVDKHHTVKLLDLGLAKLTEDGQASLTMANEENVLGTADYLAPEQALNSHGADSRSDIYSLGCTLYFLLTGRPPFPEGSISERLLKHQTAKPESIFKLRADTPPSLVDICEQMMAKKPDDRFQSAGEVAGRLTEWLSDRGRKLGGGHTREPEEGSGIGSGIFKRFSMASQTPFPGAGSSGAPASSETISAADRDTAKLSDKGSDVAEEIGLAPLEEDQETVLGGSAPKLKKSLTDSGPQLDVPSEIPVSAVPDSHKSLIEEEFSDPEADAIKRRVAQRAQYNPLKPPGYVPPKQGNPVGLWIAIGAGVVAVLGFVLYLIMSSGS